MNDKERHQDPTKVKSPSAYSNLKRAFNEFLNVPIYILIGALLLLWVAVALDHERPGWLEPLRQFLANNLFPDSQTTGNYLSVLVGGLLTVTSITLSMIMIALQQSASNMGNLVVDQFINRRRNQVHFGFFVALSVYVLILYGLVTNAFNPVIAASLALILTAVSMFVLILLVYTVFNQLRPEVIIQTVHNNAIRARQRELTSLGRTRRVSKMDFGFSRKVHSQNHGFITNIDLNVIEELQPRLSGEYEILLKVHFGSYISYGDILAEIRAQVQNDLDMLEPGVRQMTKLGIQRNVHNDSSYSLEQFEGIGWTAASSSKQNPETGLMVIRFMRDVLSRFLAMENGYGNQLTLPVVYEDVVITHLLDEFEAMAVVSSESLQYQSFAEVFDAINVLYDRLPKDLRDHVDRSLLRMLAVMGDLTLTRELEAASGRLVTTLKQAGSWDTANAIEKACDKLGLSIGELNSKSTRVPSGG